LEVNKRYSNGLTFQGTYTLAKSLSDQGGPASNGFPGENGGGRNMDSNNRLADRGDVYAHRRHRFIFTGLYEIPVGRGRQFGRDMNKVVDAVVGGWQLSSILLLQSGPYMTPTFSGGDPSGTGSGLAKTQRPDRIADGNLENATRDMWLDRNAFLCPGRTPGSATQFNCAVGINPARDPRPIGRFGNAGTGIILGPDTVNLSFGVAKAFAITEKVRLRVEGSFTNLPNRVNLSDPVLNITNNSFGRITSSRGSDFGGNRTGQVGARIDF
jgi:hypothetical protein